MSFLDTLVERVLSLFGHDSRSEGPHLPEKPPEPDPPAPRRPVRRTSAVAIIDGTDYALADSLRSKVAEHGLDLVEVGPLGPFSTAGVTVILLPLDIGGQSQTGQQLLTAVSQSQSPFDRVCLIWVVEPCHRFDYAHYPEHRAETRPGADAELLTGGSWKREVGHHAHPGDAVRCRDRRVSSLVAMSRAVPSAVDADLIIETLGSGSSRLVQALACLIDPALHPELDRPVLEWDSVLAAVHDLVGDQA